MKHHIRMLFVGGGTAGHVMPLLAVMEACQQLAKQSAVQLDCAYVGLAADVQHPLVAESKLHFSKHQIVAGKLNRFLTLRHVVEGGKMVAGYGQAYTLLRKLRPDVIYAKGGFVSIPVAYWARRMKIPLYSHETDVIPGLANRLLAKHAKKVFTSFPVEVYKGLPASKLQYVGQPVRPEFYTPVSTGSITLGHRILDDQLPIITIIGGSQGARRVNELLGASWEKLLPYAQIVHITGTAELIQYTRKAEQLPAALASRLHLTALVGAELPDLVKRSAVVISRAGGTIFEIAAAGVPCLLLPLSTASQNHQWQNAMVLQRARAALVMDEVQTTPAALTKEVIQLLRNTKEQNELCAGIARFDHPNAAQQMAKIMLTSVHE